MKKVVNDNSQVMSPEALLTSIKELSEFISEKNPSIDQICEFIVTSSFAPFEAKSAMVSYVRADKVIEQIGSYGFDHKHNQGWQKITIADALPVSDAMRTQNIVWITSADDLFTDYPVLRNYPLHPSDNCFISVPIKLKGAPLSVIGIVISQEIAPTASNVSYFEVICSLASMQISQVANLQPHESVNEQIHFLTERQKKILELMSTSMTNIEISRELGFSESTIRQETMRICEMLSVTGRKEAIRKEAIRKYKESTASHNHK